MRALSRHAIALATLIATGLPALPALSAGWQLDYLGQQIVASGTDFQGTTVGGLSGLDFDAASGTYHAISDDRSSLNAARFYQLSLNLHQFVRSATPGAAGVVFQSVTTLQTPAGTAFAPNTVDPEGIRYHAGRNTLVWSNEGQRSAAGMQRPTVREMRLDGTHLREFSVPSAYLPAGSNAGNQPGDRGIVNNLAFESLTYSVDGRTLYTATENALAQDGPTASVNRGSRSRILSFDVASGLAGAEYAYDVSPVAIAPDPAGQFATNGLTDLLAIGDRQFIGIERSFAIGAQTPGTPVTGNTIRLFHIDARHATDIAGRDRIDGDGDVGIVAASKSLLLDLSDLRQDDGSALALDNIEGLTLGPVVDGRQTLVLVSDNNFSGTQFTQFVALRISPVPEPKTWAMLLGGICAILGLGRKPGR